MRDKIIGFIISVVCFIISFGFVKGQAMALPFVPTDWTWEMYQGLHMLGDLIANDVNFDIPDWVDFNDFDDVKTFLEMIYNEGKKKVAYASIIADFCVGTWNNFLETGEVSLPFSESTIKRTHNTGFFQQIVDTVDSLIPEPGVPIPSLPEQYSQYASIGNSTFSNIDIITSNYDYNQSSPMTKHNWENINIKVETYNHGNLTGMAYTFFTNGRIDINSVGSDYRFYFSGGDYGPYLTTPSNRPYNNLRNIRVFSDYLVPWSGGSNQSSFPAYNTAFSSLDAALSYTQSNFKHIDVYVDGELWIAAGGASYIDNPLGVEIPQNVIDEVENGKISGLVIDATLPDTDNLVGSIDLGVVMDELREAQANGRTATLDGVRTKDGVRALDGTVVGTVSKAVAIDVPSTSSLVTAADEWGYIPYYPEIPSAFSGTTILSELIDATQTIVPNELIMAIWGLVIILFIIALINIFHK